MKKQLMAAIFVAYGSLQAQVVPNFDWIRNYSDQDSLENVPTAIDGASNIIVCGYTQVGANDNILVLKYDSLGTLLWTYQYDNGANDKASAVVTDASGNIYLAGVSQGTGTANDYVTIKLNASGTQQWASRYNGPTNQADGALAIGIDLSGNVYVTGGSKSSTGFDYATVKYNSSGTQQWAYRYNGTASGDDIANVLKLDVLGNLYITGKAKTATGLDIVTIKINPSTGANIWTHTSNGSANLDDQPFDMLLDGSNPVIAGVLNNTTTGEDYFVRKINGSTGATVWTYNHDCYGQNDLASSLDTTTDGYFLITGIGKTSGAAIEYHTIKLDNSGSQQWINIEPTGMSGTADGNPKIARDFLDHMYVTGQKMGASKDMYVYQITPGGNKTWAKTHDGIAGSTDIGVDFMVNWIGQLYLVGQTYNLGAKWDFTTIKISQTPVAFPPDLAGEDNDPRNLIYENKGQLINTDLDPVDNIKYYSLNNYPHLFWSEDTLSFVFAQLDTNTTDDDTLHRIDLVHLNSNPLTEIYSFEQGQGLLNYYRPHIPSGVTDVRGFQRLMIPNIYNMVDLHYYTNNGGIKYYYVVKPFGGNPSAISQYFDGADTSYINGSGQLEVVSILDTLVLSQPEAYQVIDTALTMIDLGPAPYIHTGFNTFALDTSLLDTNYIDTLPLIIVINQPLRSVGSPVTGTNVCWSTYVGGELQDKFYALDVDASGNQYTVGQSLSANYPATPGLLIDNNFSNYVYGIITKFGADHEITFSTFYGASGTSALWDVVAKNTGEIICIGYTTASDIPIMSLSGAYNDNTGSGSGEDGFVTKFDATGVLTWATYFQASGTDEAYGVDLDDSGNLYVAGYAGGSDFPLTTLGGAYNQGYDGSLNGYLAKFDNSYALNWATYYGGTASDRFESICVDKSTGSIYLSGYTKSTDLPIGTSHYDNSYNGGFNDAMVVKFNSNGAKIWDTYIGGSDKDYIADFGWSQHLITVDNSFMYFTGVTYSSNFPLLNAGGSSYFNNGYTTNADGYFMKFNKSTMALAHSTLLTGSGINYLMAIDADDNGNCFIAGSTGDIDFPLVNAPGSYFQNTLNGTWINADALMIHLDFNNQMNWSTYFAGNSTGQPNLFHDIFIDDSYHLYAAGTTSSNDPTGVSNYPVYDPGMGAYFDATYNGGPEDACITEFCVGGLVGIDEAKLALNNGFVVYPNPANGQVTFETDFWNQDTRLVIYDVLGKQCQQISISSSKTIFSTNTLESGIYFVTLKNNTKIIGAKKLIIR